jgi:hypothetical protein
MFDASPLLCPTFALALLAACGAAPAPHTPEPASAGGHGLELPVVMEDHRWFLQTTTASGAPLRIYLDSAGGMFLTADAVARLHLERRDITGDQGKPEQAVVFPALAVPGIPIPPVMAVFGRDGLDVGDGMFGAPWFAPHTFTFDYPRRKLILRAPGDVPRVPAAHIARVSFLDAGNGQHAAYGRIQMIVEGEPIEMLFDTGATVELTEAGVRALGGGAANRATSFITDQVFQAWRKAHPTWRVIEGAGKLEPTTSAPMIEVPKVTVGGFEVGPVWFTWRPDNAFHEWMAQWMDRPVEGALGGSAFYDLRITVDWDHGVAAFER